MKRLAFWAVAAVAALGAFADGEEYYYVEDPNGEWEYTIDGEVRRYTQVQAKDVSAYADSSWWYTATNFSQSAISVHIEDKPAEQGGKISADISVSPNDSAESLEGKIKGKIPVSAQGAYAAATKALAYSLVNNFRTEKLNSQVKTLGQSLQAQLLTILGLQYQSVTADDGSSFKIVSGISDNQTDYAFALEKIKSGRGLFSDGSNGNVNIPASVFEREGKIAQGSGGGASKTDAMSITNIYTDTEGTHSNTLALAGWWGSDSVGKPNGGFICDFSLEDFGKEPGSRGEEFNKHYLLTRDSTGKMHYLPMTNSVKALVRVDNVSLETNEAGVVAFHSFTNGALDSSISIGEIMGAGEEEDLHKWQTNALVVAKTREEDGSTNLIYLPLGAANGNRPDEKSIAISLVGATSNKLEIAGFATATNDASKTAVGSAFADKLFSTTVSNIQLPVKDGDAIVWLPLGNYDINETASGLEASAVSNAQGIVERKFELANWSSITNAALTAYTSVADLMTGNEAEKAEIATNLAVLAKNLKTSKLEYILLGNFEKGTDNQSVTTTNKLDAATGKSNSVYTVCGFLDADSGKVPMKVGTGDAAKLVWTNITATASNAVDNITIQNWRKAGETNGVLMVNGFASKGAEAKGLDTLLGDTKDTSTGNYKFQVLARKMDKDKTPDDSTNGLELVYIDIKDGLLGTNKWRKATDSVNRSDTRSYFDPAATNLTSGTEAVQGVALEAERMLDGSSVSTNGNQRGEILGFSGADLYTVPMKGVEQDPYSPSPAHKVEWKPLAFADSEASSFGVAGRPMTLNAELVASADADGSYKELSLYGFESAKANAMPYKYDNGEGETLLQWVDPPEGVLGSTAKVLTYDGAEIAWGDAASSLVDDASITTNTEHGAVSANTASVYGFNDADEFAVPYKKSASNGGYVTQWTDVPDDASAEKLKVLTYNGSSVQWGGASTVTNRIMAGAGIAITDNGGGAITISATPLETEDFGQYQTLTVVTAVQYDVLTHKFQCKTQMITFKGSAGTESDWIDVFEATSHEGEHKAEEEQ